MLKIIWLFGVFVACAITGSHGAPINLETASGQELAGIFSRVEDIASDRLTPEQREAFTKLANDNELSEAEAIAAIRDALRHHHNRVEGKPAADRTTSRLFCTDIAKAPHVPETKTPTKLHSQIDALRAECVRLVWN